MLEFIYSTCFHKKKYTQNIPFRADGYFILKLSLFWLLSKHMQVKPKSLFNFPPKHDHS